MATSDVIAGLKITRKGLAEQAMLLGQGACFKKSQFKFSWLEAQHVSKGRWKFISFHPSSRTSRILRLTGTAPGGGHIAKFGQPRLAASGQAWPEVQSCRPTTF
jgi:hypothetical protein